MHTPVRKKCIKQLARRSYRAFSNTITNESLVSRKVIVKLCMKIKKEMQKKPKAFSLGDIKIGIREGIPTLMMILKYLIPPHATNQVTISVHITSFILGI